jgi:chemotaxis protein MotA
MREISRKARRLRPASLLGVVAALGVLVIAQRLEGGTVDMLLRGSAAVIVIGGTLVATLISFSIGDSARALRLAAATFLQDESPLSDLTTELVRLSVRAHRDGVVALEGELDAIDDSFLRVGLALAVDGVEPAVMKGILQAEMRGRDAHDDLPVRLFESAAGYAPTFGILGAVLGLIQVMNNLATPSAFVATVYGLGLANLLLLPVAGRLRERALAASQRRQMMADAIVALQQRQNPRLVAQALRTTVPALGRRDPAPARTLQPAGLERLPA